jgi:hypothetical protein
MTAYDEGTAVVSLIPTIELRGAEARVALPELVVPYVVASSMTGVARFAH